MRKKRTVYPKDYSRDMLPHSRKEIFFDVVKLQWRTLIGCGMVLLLFYLPLLLSRVVKDLYQMQFFSELDAAQQRASGSGQALIYWEFFRCLLNIPLQMLFCLGLSGILRVIRQFAWGENVYFPTDFAKGIKDNGKQMSLLGFLFGIIWALCFSLFFFSTLFQSSILASIAFIPIILSAVFVLPVFAVCMIMIPVYTNTFFQNLKNSVYLFLRNPMKTIVALLAFLIPCIPSLLPNFKCHLFGSIAAIILMPFALLGWSLFCYNQFDKHLNQEICPELVGRGIFFQ